MRPVSVHAILLAAGAGSRLGYPKASLHVHGKWMLPEIVRNLRIGGAAQVTLVLSDAALTSIADLGSTEADQEVLNPHPEDGRTGSVLAAAAKVHVDDALLVHSCDIPLLRPEVVAQLIHAWRKQESPGKSLVRPVTPGGRGGHPLLVGSELAKELRLFKPNQPLRELLKLHRKSTLDLPILNDPGPFLDVNTTEQLALLESLIKP